jgi:hypothetical protein
MNPFIAVAVLFSTALALEGGDRPICGNATLPLVRGALNVLLIGDSETVTTSPSLGNAPTHPPTPPLPTFSRQASA